MTTTQGTPIMRNQWVWLAVIVVAAVLLIVGAISSDYFMDDTDKSGKEFKKKNIQTPTPSPSPPGKETEADVTRPGVEDRPALPVTTAPDAEVAVRRVLEPDVKGQSQYPVISTGIYEWARTKSAEELIRLINENLTMPLLDRMNELDERVGSLVELLETNKLSLEEFAAEIDKFHKEYPDLFDENGNSVNPLLENETAQKASYALAVKLQEDPSLYALFRVTLLGGTVTAHTATRLVEILGLVRHPRATDLLLELVNLPNPPVSFAKLIGALRSECRCPLNAPALDTYIRDLDNEPPEYRFGFPEDIGGKLKLPEPRIIETFLFLLDNRMATWKNADDRMLLFCALSDILDAYKQLGRGGDKAGEGTDRYFEEIFRRMEWLAKNATDPDTKQHAMEALVVYPQGERSYVPLLAALHDSNERVRLTAISKLGRFEDVPVVQTALIGVAKDDPCLGNRKVAIQSLSPTGAGRQEKLALAQAWYNPDADWMTKQEAIDLLCDCGVEAIPYLERIAQEDPDQEIRVRAQGMISYLRKRSEWTAKRKEALKLMGLEDRPEVE